jgi:hypothetical protein
MSDSAPHDWYRPHLQALVAQAAQAGFAADVSVAVITDLINGPEFSPGEPAADENWNQDIGEPATAASQIIDQDESSSAPAIAIGEASEFIPMPTLKTLY